MSHPPPESTAESPYTRSRRCRRPNLRPIPIPIAALAAAVAAGVAAARLTSYEIAERSMEPALSPGDWVLAWRRPAQLRRGDVIVLEHPQRPGFELVKRVAVAPGEPLPDTGVSLAAAEIWVTGDNPGAGSVDSRHFGAVSLEQVRARVLARYRPLPPVPIARR